MFLSMLKLGGEMVWCSFMRWIVNCWRVYSLGGHKAALALIYLHELGIMVLEINAATCVQHSVTVHMDG